jgi:hypothetical protein
VEKPEPSKESPKEKKKLKKGDIDWDELARKLPTSSTDPEQIKLRALYWKGIDNNGNGYASFSELKTGVRDVIKLKNFDEAKPVIMRAY